MVNNNENEYFLPEDTCFKFYKEPKPQYIETDASWIGLKAALLQSRSNTNCHKDEAPDNSLLKPLYLLVKA